jgi:ATP-binding cassette, subfamily B, bacterial
VALLEKVKKIKEKPLYNIRQNSVYVIKAAWIRDKEVLFVILAQIFLTVIISTVSLFLPKTVVKQILSGVNIQRLIFTILAFSVTTTILQAVKNYFDSTAQLKRTGLRVKVIGDILNKVITTDYANLEEKAFTDAKQKAQDQTGNNSTTTEQIYYCFANLGTYILGFIVYTILLVSVNPIILLITALTTLIGFWVRKGANKWQYDHDNETAVFNKKMWYLNDVGSLNDMAKDIRLFAMVDWLKDVYNTNLKLAYDFNRRVQTKHLIADVADCIATFLREGIAYGYLIWQVLNFGLSVDNFVLLFGAIGGFSVWITGILNEYSALSMHSLNYCRVREFLEYPDKFRYENGESIDANNNHMYKIELKNVSFKYPGSEEYTLEKINLVLNAGEKLAVVGLNGAGKTTLVKLICGFYDPTEGEILLDGKNIKVFNRKEYYKLFTAVFQEFNILPLTIAENVTQGFEDEINKEKLQKCFALADIDKAINSLPQKENSLMLKQVNEEAVELSGGEIQRLMLARALYKDSPVLILDEPTAALDPIAESNLYEKYNDLSKGKTAIYISHRLASTRFCDRIILLGEKTIIESGTHDELLKQGEKYAELFEIQSKYYKEEKEAV